MCLSVPSKAQDSLWIKSPLLVHLYHSKSTDIQISQNSQNLFFYLDNINIRDRRQVLLKANNILYLLPTGTGRVYQAMSALSDSVLVKRIDSTHYYGYNACCIYFGYQDVLYAFGGGGFWRNNGQLREFNKVYREWNIVQINKEFRVLNSLFFHDIKGKKLYYIETPWQDPSTGENATDYRLVAFDFKEKSNELKGILNQKLVQLLKQNPDYSFVNIPNFEGCLLNINSDNQYFIRFNENKVIKLNSPKLKSTFFGNSNGRFPTNCFAEDSTIYYTPFRDSSYAFHNIQISKKDFSDESFSLTENKTDYLWWIVLVLVVLSVGIVLWMYKRTHKKRFSAADAWNYPMVLQRDKNDLNFTNLEWTLVKAIREKSIEGSGLTVEQINAELGLAKKSLEIQKKLRTDVLNSINHTFSVITGLEEDLIERMRNEDDRRFFIYRISEEKWQLLITKMD